MNPASEIASWLVVIILLIGALIVTRSDHGKDR
jgi:hypothetical protein